MRNIIKLFLDRVYIYIKYNKEGNFIVEELRKLVDKLQQPFYIFITGVSGVGKTTALEFIEHSLQHRNISFNYSDSIGTPSIKEMMKEYGSLEKWQQASIHKWIERLVSLKDKNLIFFEGSFNPDFVNEKMPKVSEAPYIVLCLNADRKLREHRLINLRNQPHLANDDMENFASVLKSRTINTNGYVLEVRDEKVSIVANKILEVILAELKHLS